MLIMGFMFYKSFAFAQQQVELSKDPCYNEYVSLRKTHVVGYGSATSKDKLIAQQKAKLIAKDEIAKRLQSVVKSTTELYVKENKGNYSQEFNQQISESANQTLENVVTDCSSTSLEKGVFKAYFLLKIEKVEIVDNIEYLNAENFANSNIEFNKENFQKIFDSEIEKLEKQ